MPITIESFGISDIGLVRSNNEDVLTVLPERQFYLLADGMGGHKAGEVAAAFTSQSMCDSLLSIPHHTSIEDTCQLLRKAIAETNTKVFNASHQHSEYAGMGTTLTCFVIVGDYLIYAHVGDSRLYRCRKKLEQLTEDHSLRQMMGSRNAESAHAMRNVITRAIGTQQTILPDIGVIPIRKKDIYMLCSDGLSDYVEKEEIAHQISSRLSLEEIGGNLVEAALEKGGNDNITLLLVKVK